MTRPIRARTISHRRSLPGATGGLAWACLAWAFLAAPASISAQAAAQPRQLSAAQTGCDSLRQPSVDSVYEADAVDRPVRAPYVRVRALPYRLKEVLTGRTMLRFVVDQAGWVDRCTISLVEESSSEWTAAVLPEADDAPFGHDGSTGARRCVHHYGT